jgi:hypothetical protein
VNFILPALLPALLGAVIELPAGQPLAPALASAKPGDILRLGAGRHEASLGRLPPIRVEGAGMDRTRLVVPEGQDGAIVASGRVELSGLAIEVGPARSGLKIFAGGEARLDDVALEGGAVAAFVEEGTLAGSQVRLRSSWGLLQKGGEVALRRATVVAGDAPRAGLALLRGKLEVAASTVTGPFGEAAVTLSGGIARLDDVVVRAPGPIGLAVSRAELLAADVDVAGAREIPGPRVRSEAMDGLLGDCVQLRGGTARLAWGSLSRCDGTALTAAGGSVRIDGTDLHGGTAGAIVLTAGARGDLRGNWIAKRGPGLVAMEGATAETDFNRWRVDPVLWVDCGSGARVRPGFGEKAKAPCASAP